MPHITTPYQSGKVHFHNRLILPPIVTNKADANGKVTQNLLEYYKKLTQGGYFSAAIIENAFISSFGKFDRRQLSIESNDMIDGLYKLTKVIQENGTKSILQINHAGIHASKTSACDLPVGPSDIIDSNGQKHASAMNQEEITNIVDLYKSAALRAQRAGFDGIEIHSAHGFLLNQFYSPLINKRSDEYGGSVENRIRIHIEVIKAVREVVNDDFIISLRLGACDYMAGGTTIEDSEIAAVELQKAGIDLLSISGGLSGFTVPGDNSQGYFSPLSYAIKKVVSIPVLLTGGITEPLAANHLLMEQKADLIGIGRAMLQNIQWGKLAIKEA